MTTPAQPDPAALDLSGYDVRCPTCRRLLGQFIKTEAHARTLIAAHQCPEGDRPDPAAELRAAAALLRQRAADARRTTPEPWTISHGPTDGGGVLYADNGWIVADRSCDEPDESIDLPYIALMHPGVGELLADWLDGAADDAVMIGVDHRALAVARALLGSQP